MNRRIVFLHLLVLMSGIAGLGYQVVWVRMLSIALGHEVFAVLAVVAAFFGGLALGAWILDRRIARASRPSQWFAALEALIGIWALVLVFLMPVANAWLLELMGPEPSEAWRWLLSFLGPALLLAPATVAMGATLPAAERVLAGLSHDRGIGGLYGANTAGAMLGVLATITWLSPALGLSATLMIFAAINLGTALAFTVMFSARLVVVHDLRAALPAPRLLGIVFACGLLGISFEVAGIRALSQILENTIYSFAAALLVFLLATALGAAWWQRARAGRSDANPEDLIAVTGLGAAIGVIGVFHAETVYDAVRGAIGSGLGAAMAAELAAAAIVFGPAALGMGAVFAGLAQMARMPGGGIGAALAANTIGAALAPFLVGVIAIPAFGVIDTLLIVTCGYLVLYLAVSGQGWINGRAVGLIPLALAIALSGWALFGPFDHKLVRPPPGGSIYSHVEGISSSASTVDTAGGVRYLRVNGTLTMGGTASYTLDRLQAQTALMQMVEPRHALFLGIGTGATIAGAAVHPKLHTKGVDISPEVISLIRDFPEVAQSLEQAGDRVTLQVADARRTVRTAPRTYDLILADTYHPARDGAGLLYTREHFVQIRKKLGENGLIVQWLPLHQLDIETLRLIVRTYLSVFPDARMYMGNYNLGTPLIALHARVDGALPDLEEIAKREVPLPVRSELRALNLETPFALFGGFIGGGEELAAWAGEGPLNTDDLPLVQFQAPRSVYEPLGPASERLLELVEAFTPRAHMVADFDGVPRAGEIAARLEAYWQARDAFLVLGTKQGPSGDLATDIRDLAPSLVALLRISPDFDPAYRPVFAMAQAALTQDREVAMTLLRALARAAPHRVEAQQLLMELGG